MTYLDEKGKTRLEPGFFVERKSRVAKRELTSRGLSPRGPQRANGWRQPRGLLSTQGRGQHPTVTSQQAPTWMASGVTTNQRQRGSGIRC